MTSGISGPTGHGGPYDRGAAFRRRPDIPHPSLTESPLPMDLVLRDASKRTHDRFYTPMIPRGADASARALLNPSMRTAGLASGRAIVGNFVQSDGLLGSVLLFATLNKLHKVGVGMVGSEADEYVMRELLKEIHGDLGKFGQILVFDPPPKSAAGEARGMAEEFRFDAVGAVGVAGANEHGKYIGTRGNDKTLDTVPLDKIVQIAIEMGLDTHAYLSKGNQVGAGGLPDIPLALDGQSMQAAIEVDYPVTASRFADIAALATAQRMLQLAGKRKQMWTPDEVRKLAYTAMKLIRDVATDQVMGHYLRPERVADGERRMRKVVANLEDLNDTMHNDPPNEFVRFQPPTDGRPIFLLGADSGVGVAQMGLTVLRYLIVNLPISEDVQLIMLAHLEKAPFGPLTPPQLIEAGREMLRIAARLGPDVQGSFCNTLTNAFPDAFIENEVENLVNITCEAIANPKNRYGAHPVVYATMGMAGSGRYQTGIAELSNNKIDPLVIGCPNWATIIDTGRHMSTDPEDIEYVTGEIDNALDELQAMMLEKGLRPQDVKEWLPCCTHYAEERFSELVTARMKLRGFTPAFRDPAIHMAEKIKAAILEAYDAGLIDRSNRKPGSTPIAISSDVVNLEDFKAGVMRIWSGMPSEKRPRVFGVPFVREPTPELEAVKSLLFESSLSGNPVQHDEQPTDPSDASLPTPYEEES